MTVLPAIERVLPRHRGARRGIRVMAVTIPTLLWVWVWWPVAIAVVVLAGLVRWA